MPRFLSKIWGQSKPADDGAQRSGQNAPCIPTTGAASWITMGDPAHGGRAGGEPVMSVSQSTIDDVLNPLGDTDAVNVVAIFGAARGGKSFLMNQLAGKDDIFKISNDKDPCTQGVDISRAVVPLKEFATVDGCRAPPEVSGSNVRVLFADVEGQGDRDVAYDARLASAILPVTKCVIFNWRDSLQVDRILNLLGVMHRAALNVDLGDDGERSSGRKFGHLHVVFRDWNYSGTAMEVKNKLFGLDNRGVGAEVAVKNEIRRTIQAAFASVTVWLFPAPVEMTSELSKELTKEDLSEGFVSQLAALRSSLSSQLSEPTAFGLTNPVTGHSVGSLVPALVDVLNRGDVIMPQSVYQQMLAMEAEALRNRYLAEAGELIELGKSACDHGPAFPPADLEADMQEQIQVLIAKFESEAKGIGVKEDVIAEGLAAVTLELERGMEGLRAYNRTALGRHLKAAVKTARETFTREFTQATRAKMPLAQSELSALAADASSRANDIVKKVPSAGEGDDSVEEALLALGDFVELAASKAERENAALLLEQGKEEDEALASAVTLFHREFRTDSSLLKAGGAPYKLTLVEKAGETALSTAVTALRRALSNGGGAASGRVSSLVARLEETARTALVEATSDYQRDCAAAMMKLGIEERRRLRSETERDVYPQLPLQTNAELEEAFKPVLRRVNSRVDMAANGWTLTEAARAEYKDAVKSDAESVWQALVERNERVKLQQENASAEAEVRRQQQEADELRHRLEKEKERTAEAEGSARDAAEVAAAARRAALKANQRAKQEMGAREREAAAREQERREEAARRAEEKGKAEAEKAASLRAAQEATAAAAAAEKATEELKATRWRSTAAARRTSSRRQTIMTPIGKDPAALEKAREEASQQIKEREEKAIKHLHRLAGMTKLQKSKMKAKDWRRRFLGQKS